MRRIVVITGTCLLLLAACGGYEAPESNFRQNPSGTGSSATNGQHSDSGSTDFTNEVTPETHDSLEVPAHATGATVQVTLVSSAIVLGDPTEAKRLVIITDYGCQYCRDFGVSALPSIIDTYVATGRMSVELTFLPFSPDGDLMARAAICMATKGKFAQANQSLLRKRLRSGNDKDLAAFAKEQKVTLKELSKCLMLAETNATIETMKIAAEQHGISRVPSFRLGEASWEGLLSPTELAEKIQKGL
jgi:protein-disulfide isomerase